MSEEKYIPSEEEMAQADSTMHGYQKELSEKREALASEADMELMKKSKLNLHEMSPGQLYMKGTVDGERISASYFTRDKTCYFELNGVEIKEPETAAALWNKYAPIAELIKQSEKIEKDILEKTKLTASRLLGL